ncbi:hypothetical protein JBE27_52615, partial [Streptomyces albiflaviniger]|nr:hypothetical protein [Streptomyces albiflaviniger]
MNPRPGGNNFNNANPRPGGNHFNNNNATNKADIICFECGIKGHYSNECPKKKNAAPNTNAPGQQQRRIGTGRNTRNQPATRGRLNHMNAEEAQEAPDIVLGMFLVNSVPARVLFDSRASHSFVTKTFAYKSKMEPTPLKQIMLVQIPGPVTKAR